MRGDRYLGYGSFQRRVTIKSTHIHAHTPLQFTFQDSLSLPHLQTTIELIATICVFYRTLRHPFDRFTH
ncbi:hypothetical protein L1887_29018 [Cichorium endivia]|nr:hypothetical protein L1887_29018 [Cichorium endivia]